MRGRILLAWIAASGLVGSANVYALGLGDIELNSALNQPLDAEINLLSVKPTERNQISVKLADDVAFSASGVDRAPMLNNLTFQVEAGSDGNTYVKVTSREPIREPFLDFIVEVNWPSGRLLREYTLLLDPPIFASDTVAPVQAPETRLPDPIRSTRPEPQAPQRPAAQTPRAEPSAPTSSAARSNAPPSPASVGSGGQQLADRDYGPVRKNETLWDVAERTRPSSGVSIERMMVGLYQENPNAFIGENINNLKAGFVLRVPEGGQLEQIGDSEAKRVARQHYREWLEARRKLAAADTTASGTEAGLAEVSDVGIAGEGGASAAGASEPKLRLVSPEDGAGLGAGGDAEAQAMQEDLDRALRDAELARQEKDELEQQLADAKDQLAMMERLLTLKDDALVELQNRFGVTPKELEGAPEQAKSDSNSVAVIDTEPTGKQAASAPPPQEPQRTESWMDLLMTPAVLGGIVGTLLVAGLGAWVAIRRRRASDDDYEDFTTATGQNGAESLNFGMPAEAGMGAGAAVAAAVTMPEMGAPHDIPSETAFGEDLPATVGEESIFDEIPDGPLGTIHAEEGDIDPIAEADVYLAYRRYQQAEDLVREALRNEPEREDLQLKLLEIFYAAGNRDSFEAQAEAMYAQLAGQESGTWAKVSEMGRELCPDHPLFSDSGMSAAGLGDHVEEVPSEDMDLGAFAASNRGENDGGADEQGLFGDLGEQGFDLDQAAGAGSGPYDADALDTGLDEGSSGIDFGSGDQMQAFGQASAVEDPHGMDFEPGLGGAANVLKGPGFGKADSALHSEHDNAVDFDLGSFASAGESEDQPDHAFRGEDNVLDWSANSDKGATDLHALGKEINNDEPDFFSDAIPQEFGGRGMGADEEEQSPQPVAGGSDFGAGEVEEIFTGLDDNDGLNDDSDLFAGSDMVGTKLDLARAYIDMDDKDGARGILTEVIQEGNEEQKQEAQALIHKIG